MATRLKSPRIIDAIQKPNNPKTEMKFQNSMTRLLPVFSLQVCACLLISFADVYNKSKTSQSGAIKVNIVAAENFYGGVARQIAGNSGVVASILSNPNQDPHEFTTDAATALAVANADIVIYNGIGYDDWMAKLLGAQGKAGRIVIRVADLIGAKAGDNPHIWYDPHTMPALAAKLAEILKQPENPAAFQNEINAVTAKIAEIKSAYSGTVVTATEPVFGYMASALGFKMENYSFQLAVMNDTEVSFQQASDFEKSLHDKSMKILFYNSQVSDPVTQRMREIARKNGVAVIGVAETQPPDAKNYADWMIEELNQVQTALEAKH
jgi:zinc/manganese transport system substrate-binding protein